MLKDYSEDRNISMDIPKISESLHYYTSGYPFLVSKLCKIIDEEIIVRGDRKSLDSGRYCRGCAAHPERRNTTSTA